MSAIIKLSNSALFEMVMATFEAYAVKHDGKEIVSIETHAQLWGKVNKTHPFKCAIEHVSVDTSAEMERGQVTNSLLSLDIKKDIASVFGDGYEHIGTFHSHPWLRGEDGVNSKGKEFVVKNANTIRKNKLYNFSSGDHECEFSNPTIAVGKKQYSVGLVMTIYSTERADDNRDDEIEPNLFEFSLGNVKVWLKAQAYEHKSTDNLPLEDEKAFDMYGLDYYDHFEVKNTLPIPVETILECDFFDVQGTYLEGFGRLNLDLDSADDDTAEYRNKIMAEKRCLHSD